MSFYKRTVTLPEMYEHVKPGARIIDFAEQRLSDIDKEVEQLALERSMWETVKDRFEKDHCQNCAGRGEVGYYPHGMEDGMRFKTCPACKGTGKP